MKTLVVAPQPYYVERGTPIAVRQLVGSLAAQGHDVHLLCYPIGDDPGDAGVTVHRCARVPLIRNMPIGFSLSKLVYDVPLSVAIFRLCRRERFDVVHAVEESVYPALLVKRFGGVKVVYDMDSSLADQLVASKPWLSFLKGLFSWFERAAIRNADAVAAVCDELADQARDVVAPAKVHTLYDVPNDDGADASGDVQDLSEYVEAGQRIGLYIGNLEPYQGIDLLLDALARLPGDLPLKSIIVGGSEAHIAHYRRKAADAGIADRVVFIGPRPLSQLPGLLEQAFLLYSPRITGGNTPMKLYSYMASGRPVVATNLSTHTQVLDDSSAVLPSPTPEDYAQGILALVRDPEAAERTGAAALRLVREKYSRERYAETLGALYAQLV